MEGVPGEDFEMRVDSFKAEIKQEKEEFESDVKDCKYL